MLVLSRKQNETICIDEAIEVNVLEIRGNRVRLGISAPRGVSIHRFELHSCLVAERQAVPTTVELPQAN